MNRTLDVCTTKSSINFDSAKFEGSYTTISCALTFHNGNPNAALDIDRSFPASGSNYNITPIGVRKTWLIFSKCSGINIWYLNNKRDNVTGNQLQSDIREQKNITYCWTITKQDWLCCYQQSDWRLEYCTVVRKCSSPNLKASLWNYLDSPTKHEVQFCIVNNITMVNKKQAHFCPKGCLKLPLDTS